MCVCVFVRVHVRVRVRVCVCVCCSHPFRGCMLRTGRLPAHLPTCPPAHLPACIITLWKVWAHALFSAAVSLSLSIRPVRRRRYRHRYPLGAWEYHSSKQLIKTTATKPLRVFHHCSEHDLGYNTTAASAPIIVVALPSLCLSVSLYLFLCGCLCLSLSLSLSLSVCLSLSLSRARALSLSLSVWSLSLSSFALSVYLSACL